MPEGLTSWPAVIELMLWMRYCDDAIINCDNYGGDITFDFAISREEREERDDRQKGKKTKSSEFIMKSSIRVCVHRKSSEWKESSESRKSRKSRILVYSQWNLECEVNSRSIPEWP